MNRRDFLKTLGITGGIALNAGHIADVLAQVPTNSFNPSDRDPIIHMLNRLTYGATPDLYEHVKQIGIDAYIEEQLNPDVIDDSALENRLADYDVTWMTTPELVDTYRGMGIGMIIRQMATVYTLRARYSNRQLFERMAGFWTDHFHIFLGDNPAGFFKPVDERDVVRAHALGTFPDMLRASAHSPAMLLYLDNAQSEKTHPNENYSRELLELHTLGVDGGYTEDDVKAVARAFTGWSFTRPRASVVQRGEPGTFMFRPFIHDDDAKTILGHTLPANNGKADGDAVLDILAEHESTARFISIKLARRFVADVPRESLVNQLTETYLQTNGDIKQMMRTLIYSDEFWNAPPKFKRPFEYTVSILRGLNYQEGRIRGFQQLLQSAFESMGQIPYLWPAPNGYPDVGQAWANNLLPRWNTVIGIINKSRAGEPDMSQLEALAESAGVIGDDPATIQFFANYLLGRELNTDEFNAVSEFINEYNGSDRALAGIALLMIAPAFQYK